MYMCIYIYMYDTCTVYGPQTEILEHISWGLFVTGARFPGLTTGNQGLRLPETTSEDTEAASDNGQ